MARESGTSSRKVVDLMVKNLKGGDPDAYDEAQLEKARRTPHSRFTAGRTHPPSLNPDGSLVRKPGDEAAPVAPPAPPSPPGAAS